MTSSTSVWEYFPQDDEIERVARALAMIEGIKSDQHVWMTAAHLATVDELKMNVYPITMYGPAWMRQRREAMRMIAAIKAMRDFETL